MKDPEVQVEKENHDSQLRKETEAKLALTPSSHEMKGERIDELLHELQVHQIELEMQNGELRRTRFALEGIKDRYIELYDYAPVGYFTLTSETLIKEANLTGATLLGLERNKLINRGFGRFVVPEELNHWDRHFLNTLKNWDGQSCELSLARKDGSRLFVRLESIKMETMDGKPEVRIAMTEITQMRQIEEDIRLARYYTKSIVDTVHEPLLVLDGALKVISASQSFYQEFKVSPHENVGRCLYDLGNRQWDIPKLRELLENILSERTKFENVEIEHDFPAIGYRKMLLNAKAITGKDDKTYLILLAMKDVTERML